MEILQAANEPSARFKGFADNLASGGLHFGQPCFQPSGAAQIERKNNSIKINGIPTCPSQLTIEDTQRAFSGHYFKFYCPLCFLMASMLTSSVPSRHTHTNTVALVKIPLSHLSASRRKTIKTGRRRKRLPICFLSGLSRSLDGRADDKTSSLACAKSQGIVAGR